MRFLHYSADQADGSGAVEEHEKPVQLHPQDLPPAERIIKRLTSYDPRVPGPVLQSSANRPPPVPSAAVAGLTEPDLEPLPHLQALSDLAESFGNNHRAYGSLNCAHAELCHRLWGEVN